jgi:ribosome biogenesis protein MAK21
MKRLCILTTQASSSISAGLLFLLSEMCAAKPEALRLLTASEGEEATEHLGEYFHLGSYDAVKREPEYACSAAPSSWELSLVRNHFHPSVAAFTNNLLAPPHKIEFNGDDCIYSIS